jgi:hypothetical protein
VRLASYELTIAAPIEVVWAHLTTAEGLTRWIGPAAVADPVAGEIDLREVAGGCTLRLVHHGLPPAAVDDHERGWAYFLGELDACLIR